MENKISDLTRYLEELAPLSLQENYDNCGLLTGNPDWPVQSVLCSLDCTPEVIAEAESLGCNVVVCHHPVIFRGLKSLAGDSYVDRTLIAAIKADIAIYAIHTNLDNVLRQGVNGRIAQKIGIREQRVLVPRSPGIPELGAGVIGELEGQMSLPEFLLHLKNQFACKSIRHTLDTGRKINRVAACGGSGSFLTREAIAQGADVLVTADFKYHDFFDAGGRIVLIDLGHYESEQFTVELLYELISGKFPNFATHCTKIVTNPIKYF